MGIYIGLDIPLPAKANTDYIAGTVVCVDSIDTGSNLPVPAVAASVTKVPIGIIRENTDHLLGQKPTVRMGGIQDAIAGAAIDPSVENRLTFDTSGYVIPMPATTGDYPIVGLAVEKCTTSGDLVRVLVNPTMQHHA